MNINIDVKAERIESGFLMHGAGSGKIFYRSIEEFIKHKVSDDVRDVDRYFNEHNSDGEVVQIKICIEPQN